MVVEATLETQTMKAEIRELKEKSEVTNDVIDSMWEMMDKLENDVKALKAK